MSDMSPFFFCQFSINTQKYIFVFFFEENEEDTRFFQFFRLLFKIKYHPISRKEKNEKPFFVFFFQKFKTHIFRQVRVKFFAS